MAQPPAGSPALRAQVKASGRRHSQTPALPPPRLFTARGPWCHWYPKLPALCSGWSPQQPEVSLGRWMSQQIFIKHCASSYGGRWAASLGSRFFQYFLVINALEARGQVTFIRLFLSHPGSHEVHTMDSFTGQDPEARDFGVHAPAPSMPAVHTLVSLGFPFMTQGHSPLPTSQGSLFKDKVSSCITKSFVDCANVRLFFQ